MFLKLKIFSAMIGLGLSLCSFAVDFRPFNSTFSLSVTKAGGQVFVCSSVAIGPTTLLTAAHCLDDAQNISVSDHQFEREAMNWDVHPEYDKEESNYHADIGIITLFSPLPSYLNYPPTGRPKEDSSLVRIGFGGREGNNLRTYISGINVLDKRENTLILKDKLGVPGDSGGPLFQYIHGVLTLVAVHSTVEGEKSYAPIINAFVR
jgi:V8-like Glu-specific endopeptidase